MPLPDGLQAALERLFADLEPGLEQADLAALNDRQLAALLHQVWLDTEQETLESEALAEAVLRLAARGAPAGGASPGK